MAGKFNFDEYPASNELCYWADSAELIKWLADVEECLVQNEDDWLLLLSRSNIRLEMRRRIRWEEQGRIGYAGCKEVFAAYI